MAAASLDISLYVKRKLTLNVSANQIAQDVSEIIFRDYHEYRVKGQNNG